MAPKGAGSYLLKSPLPRYPGIVNSTAVVTYSTQVRSNSHPSSVHSALAVSPSARQHLKVLAVRAAVSAAVRGGGVVRTPGWSLAHAAQRRRRCRGPARGGRLCVARGPGTVRPSRGIHGCTGATAARLLRIHGCTAACRCMWGARGQVLCTAVQQPQGEHSQ